MTALLHHPIALLLITGTLIGINFPLGKIASAADVSPVLWAMLVSLGVSVTTLPYLAVKQRLYPPRDKMLRYVLVSGTVSFVVPNLILFSVIPHVGSGFAGLMFALSPVCTLSLSMLFRLNTPPALGVIGIVIGLLGAGVVTFARSHVPEAPPLVWIAAALVVPVTLACGNIYRTLDWPEGSSPDVLAFWSHLSALTVFVALLLVTTGNVPLTELARIPGAAVAQAVVSGLTFPVFFRLQRIAGPVLLSQIGYVAAAVGLLAATVFLGERYDGLTWVGAAVIAVGIGATVTAQARRPAVDEKPI